MSLFYKFDRMLSFIILVLTNYKVVIDQLILFHKSNRNR